MYYIINVVDLVLMVIGILSVIGFIVYIIIKDDIGIKKLKKCLTATIHTKMDVFIFNSTKDVINFKTKTITIGDKIIIFDEIISINILS